MTTAAHASKDRPFWIVNGVVSVVALALLAYLLLLRHGAGDSTRLAFMPAINASFNGAAAVLLVVLGVYVAGALLEGSRRTAQAPIEILASSPQQTVGRSGPQPGWRVQYAFEAADGQTYVNEAFRTGSLDEIGAGHACYEPTNPDNNELVRATVGCPQ